MSWRRTGAAAAKLDLGLGLNFLGSIIGAFGGQLGVKAQYRQANSIVFTYEVVQEESVPPAKLDAFLSKARVRDDMRTVGRLLDSADVYVFTQVLKTQRVGVEAFASNGKPGAIAATARAGGGGKKPRSTGSPEVLAVDAPLVRIAGF